MARAWQQTRELKALLKAFGITDNYGRLSVRVTKKYTGKHRDTGESLYDYGPAVAHVRYLTDEERAALLREEPSLVFWNRPDYDFTVVWSWEPQEGFE